MHDVTARLLLQVLGRYNVLWQLLLRLRRGRTAVDATWHHLKARADLRSGPSSSFARLLALRLSLAHLLTALLSHLQVLPAGWAYLHSRVGC